MIGPLQSLCNQVRDLNLLSVRIDSCMKDCGMKISFPCMNIIFPYMEMTFSCMISLGAKSSFSCIEISFSRMKI